MTVGVINLDVHSLNGLHVSWEAHSRLLGNQVPIFLCRMDAKAVFELKVDVPFPLNITPAAVIEGTGDVAVKRVLTSLMDTLCASIVRDQVAWVKARKGGHVRSCSSERNGVTAMV
jgi:hypothetical protein